MNPASINLTFELVIVCNTGRTRLIRTWLMRLLKLANVLSVMWNYYFAKKLAKQLTSNELNFMADYIILRLIKTRTDDLN